LADIRELVATVTESQYWTNLRAAFDAAETQWRAWSARNPFMVVSRFVTKAAEAAREEVAVIAASGFLDFASGLGLTFFARSQYQLERQPATFTTGRIILQMSSVVAAAPIAAGAAQVGTPGPITAQSRLFVSLQDFTLQPGEANIVNFTATASGDLHNLPVGAPVDLKTSIPGVTASLAASGPPVTFGTSNASLLLFAAQDGVEVLIQDPLAALQPLTVVASIPLKRVTITLGTDGASALNSTAAQVRQALADAIKVPATNMGQLLLAAQLGGDGTGIVQTAALTDLEWTGTWIESPGQKEQSDPSLKQDCANRFPTMGGGSGDGAPVSTAQTEDAIAFWAKQPPAGYTRTPVEQVRVYTDIDDTGAVDGAAALVVLAGVAGPVYPADVTAVAANFETPRKYSYGITLRTISAEAYSLAVSGAVVVRRRSGRSIAEVQAAVAAAFAAWQADIVECEIGGLIDNGKIRAVVIDADRAAIQSFTPTAPLAPVALSFKQIAVPDLSALTYAYDS
jgi:hypothetical protein